MFFFVFFLSGAGFCEEMGRRFQEITIYHETAEGQFRKSSRQPGSNMAPCYIMMLGIKGHWSEDDISHVCVMWHRYSTFRCAGKLLMDAGQPKRQQAPARAAPRQPASALGYHTDMCRCLASLLGDDNRV